jgi:hypothetical protein
MRKGMARNCLFGTYQVPATNPNTPPDYDGLVAGDRGNDRLHMNVVFLCAFAGNT